ncbi:MAG TPA: hypothetical protein VIG08_05755 [Gemmatimonadales bacterium]|jgi:hypothetical protein
MLRAIPLALLLAAASTEVAAQWSVGTDITVARFWGGSQEEHGDRAFRPYRPTIIGILLEGSVGPMRVGVHGYYGSVSLALEGGEAVVAVKDALSVHGAAVEVSRPVATLGTDSRFVIVGGFLIESWSLAGETSHVRAGFSVGAGLEVSLGGRWRAVGRGGIAVSGSPFSETDLDAGFAPRTLWRREVTGRLQFRL